MEIPITWETKTETVFIVQSSDEVFIVKVKLIATEFLSPPNDR